MRWRLAVSCTIIMLIISGGTLMLHYTGGIYDRMLAELQAAVDESDTSGESLRAAHAIWTQNMPLICTQVGDSHADAITQSFARALSFSERRSEPEYVSSLSDLISGIKHLKSYDRPSIRSIL